MKKISEIYHNLAEALANLFSPMAEVGLYNEKNEELCLYNRLTHDTLEQSQPYQQVKLVINKNKTVKMMIIPLDKGYYLRLICDTSLFESLELFLQKFLVKEINTSEAADWQQLVDNFIEHYLQKNNSTLSALNSKTKRSLILAIHEKNLFRYQDATNYLARKLEVSRATIYNYLKQANQLKSLEIHQVDAFTDQPFSGNPAGVVLDADHLDEVMMKKIAREMNLSETAFVLKSKKADIKLRYFTPNGSEVKFCGHSTVGALYMLAHRKKLGMDKPGHYEFMIEANVGIIEAAIALESNDMITVEFRTPQTNLVTTKLTYKEVAQALGISLDSLNQQIPIMFEKTNQDLYLTISSLQQLGELQVDSKSAKQFAEKHNIVAYVLLCNETFVENNHIHMRCFAPAVGIQEDPFTGSVLGGLATYVTKYGLIDKRLKTICVEQGNFISRPGFVELKLDPKHPHSPLVMAKARHFFSTEIEHPFS